MKKGKFIVIEGTDASGKTTQFNMLRDKLKIETDNLLIADFPRYYDSPFGQLAGDLLAGRLGKFKEISPYLALMPYMIDQYTWSRDVGRVFLEGGGTIIANRYFTSNVHQIAKLKGKERVNYRDWLWPLGYKHLGLLKPDLVVFLDVPPEIGRQLNKTKKERAYLKGKQEDEAEKDFRHQKESYREYLLTVEKEDYWVGVKCTQNGELKSPEEIHEMVWRETKLVTSSGQIMANGGLHKSSLAGR